MFDEQGRADVWVVGEGVGEKMVSWDLSILVVARVCLSLSLSKFSYAQQYQIIYSPAPCCAFTKIRRRQFQAEKSSSTLRTFKSPNQQRGARSLNLEKFDTQSSEPKVQQRIALDARSMTWASKRSSGDCKLDPRQLQLLVIEIQNIL